LEGSFYLINNIGLSKKALDLSMNTLSYMDLMLF
jgi:hypothetical protein